MLPLFPGVPGGLELLVVLLVLVVVLGVPALVLLFGGAYFGSKYLGDGEGSAPGRSAEERVEDELDRRRSDGSTSEPDDRDERIAELEREVERLRAEVDGTDGIDGTGGAEEADTADGIDDADRPGDRQGESDRR
jgi:sec-independent protein translocase protein TatA